MPAGHEKKIAAAIAAVRNGQTQKAAADQYGVATSTLSDRLHGRLSREEAHKTDRLLSPEIEDQIVDWIHKSESAGRRPHHWEITQFAQCILKAQGSSHTIGSHWVDRFIQRHPSVEVKRQETLEAADMDEYGLHEGESFHGTRPTTPEEVPWRADDQGGWVTPKSSQELIEQFESLADPILQTDTAKALIQKAGKRIDLLAAEIAAEKQKTEALKAEHKISQGLEY
ncbi:hypothetical protein FHL15_004635 [Xylaria flabelliformis]|uniref:HTH CENPB-type domain-containing protein n=1 Tax=Xylaria flabelliformis TaxID=2512241 RepID=A0A553I2Q1_9PEZI|nr:hypothetical protein FHL15_004635 [Xylaria flabelliformis]